MADAWDLSVGFLENHAPEAARVLESLPTVEASAFLTAVPPRLGARVLASMLPTAGARILNAVDEASAQALLQAASTQTAVAMLRHLPQSARARLIAALPPASALASQLLLGFPDDTVGAWTDPDVPSALHTLHVDAVLSRIRAEGTAGLQLVYVLDVERRLLGTLSMEALLRADATDRVVHLLRPAPTALAMMMPVASARDLPAWERATALPVVDHDKRLIGVLRRTALAQALRARPRAATEDRSDASVAATLATSYWGIVSALSGITLAFLPSVRRVMPEE